MSLDGLQGELRGDGSAEIHVSCGQTIEINKMFGPLIFWSIRATADLASGDWIIERNFGPVGEWREVTRVPGQLEADFA